MKFPKKAEEFVERLLEYLHDLANVWEGGIEEDV